MTKIKKKGKFCQVELDDLAYSFRYKMNCVETWPNYYGSDRDGVQAIIDEMGFSDDVKYGKTKIFIRSPQTIFTLEKQRAEKLPPLVLFLQRVTVIQISFK